MKALFTFLFMIVLISAKAQQPGSLDKSFGNNGIVAYTVH